MGTLVELQKNLEVVAQALCLGLKGEDKQGEKVVKGRVLNLFRDIPPGKEKSFIALRLISIFKFLIAKKKVSLEIITEALDPIKKVVSNSVLETAIWGVAVRALKEDPKASFRVPPRRPEDPGEVEEWLKYLVPEKVELKKWAGFIWKFYEAEEEKDG